MIVATVVDGITVKVTRSKTKNDELEFASTDKGICNRYNAQYLSYTYNRVKCLCKQQSFYNQYTGVAPQCQNLNMGENNLNNFK